MPIDFPASPVSGQRYSYDLRTWEYNGGQWIVVTTGAISLNVDGGGPDSNYGGSGTIDGGGIN